jgi:hypothetical protein
MPRGHRVSYRKQPVAILPVSTEELIRITKKEAWVDRRDWSNQILALVQSRPNEWLKLEGGYTLSLAPRYLKPLGIKYTMDTTKYEASKAVLYVKWESK